MCCDAQKYAFLLECPFAKGGVLRKMCVIVVCTPLFGGVVLLWGWVRAGCPVFKMCDGVKKEESKGVILIFGDCHTGI